MQYKFSLLLLASFFSFITSASTYERVEAELSARKIMEVSRDDVKERLAAFDQSLIDYRLDDAVFERIVNYLENWPISTGRMLAKSARFYPIFEEQLRAAGLPLELKHLSIPESALRSFATSSVGAGGLWQLMPGTARELGLTVNEELDERLDPALGCAAGLDYLRIQYERYGDWAVALAAYNCGPGNVNRAIRRSGSDDYWKMRRFLPRETRDYVPNFIAAVYLMSYHHLHDRPASVMELDMQIIDDVTVYRKLSLYRVAQVTGLLPGVVIELNPQYLRGYLPGVAGGHALRLPKRVMPAMQEYLANHAASEREDAIALPWTNPRLAKGELDPDRFYAQFRISAGQQDTTARTVADNFNIPVDRLLIWSNRGEKDSIQLYDEFFFYAVEKFLVYDPRIRYPPTPAPLLPGLPITTPVAIGDPVKPPVLYFEWSGK